PAPEALTFWTSLFTSLARHAATIEDIVGALAQEHGAETYAELQWWAESFSRQVQSFTNDLREFMPWAQSSWFKKASTGSTSDSEIQGSIDASLTIVPTLAELPEIIDKLLLETAGAEIDLSQPPNLATTRFRDNESVRLTTSLETAAAAVRDLLSRLVHLAQECDQVFEEMDFRFLFDEERKLFAIGYNVTDLRPDNSFYDLLASEARLASFIAIAKGDVPQEHWFRMGRQLTSVNGSQALISWTGTMFEYLMPLLVMRNYEGTLLDQTCRAVVERQIEYGRERGVPWGISESAYNVRDLHLNYQYGPFGVPGLGLKRGLIEDLVTAPYATVLAAMVNPRAAMDNLRLLAKEGALS